MKALVLQWKIDPGSHIHMHMTLFHIKWVWKHDKPLTRCNQRLLQCFQHTCFGEGYCVSVCEAGWKSRRASTERGERFTAEVRCCRLQILLFSWTAFSVRDRIIASRFLCPDLYLCCAGNSALIIRSVRERLRLQTQIFLQRVRRPSHLSERHCSGSGGRHAFRKKQINQIDNVSHVILKSQSN